jgi:DNA-3-methyladenine glycosylase
LLTTLLSDHLFKATRATARFGITNNTCPAIVPDSIFVVAYEMRTLKGGTTRADRPAGARLGRNFFERPALQVARDLIGKYIVRDYRGRQISSMITETEAYKGPVDRASRAFGGRRTRSLEALYKPGGSAYVYLVYGMHWLLNIKSAGPDKPEAVLIRGVLSETGPNQRIVDGPGRVTRFLKVDGSLNGDDITTSDRIWIEDRGVQIPCRRVKKGPRVGIDYAGTYWAAKPWRFRVDYGGMLGRRPKKT